MNRPAFLTEPFAPAHITTAEFRRMIDADVFDGDKVELVDGVIERMQMPRFNHASLQAEMFIELVSVFGKGRVFGEFGIQLGGDTVLGCDNVVAKAVPSKDDWLRPSDILLVVEVAQTTQARDMGMKRVKYADAGIGHYWVVDGKRSVIHVYGGPQDGDYAMIGTVPFGQPLPVPGTDRTITIG